MEKQIKKYPEIDTFCTATDGNHGHAVVWMAKKLNRNEVIYMPKESSTDRIQAIKKRRCVY